MLRKRTVGLLLALGAILGTIALFQAATPPRRPLRTLRHGERIVRVAFSPDWKLLATQGSDDGIRAWDRRAWRPVARLRDPRREPSILRISGFSGDGRIFTATGQDGCVRLWDTGTWRITRRLRIPGGYSAVLTDGGLQIWPVPPRNLLLLTARLRRLSRGQAPQMPQAPVPQPSPWL